jgi:hypothetical protein
MINKDMATNNSYLGLLDSNLSHHVYKMLFNEVLRELVPSLIQYRKNQIFRAIWQDPYLHAILSEGVIKEIIIDKDTYDFNDQQYFIIVNTNIHRAPCGSRRFRLRAIFEQLVLIVSRSGAYGSVPFNINNTPECDTDPDSETYDLMIPVSF